MEEEKKIPNNTKTSEYKKDFGDDQRDILVGIISQKNGTVRTVGTDDISVSTYFLPKKLEWYLEQCFAIIPLKAQSTTILRLFMKRRLGSSKTLLEGDRGNGQ